MIDQLPCGCSCIIESYQPQMEHVTEYAARFFDGSYPGRRERVACWIDKDGARMETHGCTSGQRFNESWALAGM